MSRRPRVAAASAAAVDVAPRDAHRLPDWPRAMNAELATAYVGQIGEPLLRRLGPKPVHIGARTVWLRDDLDRWLDDLRGGVPDRGNPWG